MKAGILLCDHTREHLRDEFGDYPERFLKIMAEFNPSLEVVIFDVTVGDFPKSPKDADVFLISGSKASVFENIPWINQLKDFIVQCHQQKAHMLGVCFGHQLIALALGGVVERSDKGWGIGIHTYQIYSGNEYFENRTFIKTLVSHRDQVTAPPKGAKLYAGNDFCPYAMLGYGSHIITIQGHPELCNNYIKTILGIRREDTGEQVYKQANLSLESTPDSMLILKALMSMLGIHSKQISYC